MQLTWLTYPDTKGKTGYDRGTLKKRDTFLVVSCFSCSLCVYESSKEPLNQLAVHRMVEQPTEHALNVLATWQA